MDKKVRAFRIILVILCFLGYFLYALMHNSFGANAATIMSFFEIDEARGGLILTFQAVSSIVVTVYLGLFGERHNKILGVAFGVGVFAVAGVLIGLIPYLSAINNTYSLMLFLSLVAGMGYITVDLLTNGLIADVYPKNKTALLQYVHAFYSVGSMASPLFVTLVVDPENAGSFSMPYLMIGAAAGAVCAGFIIISRKVTPTTPYSGLKAVRKSAKSNPAEIFRDVRAWFFLAACFFYMCFQTGIATWLPTFCSNYLGFDFKSAGLMVTMYFLGSLTIRFLAPIIYKGISVRTFYICSLLSSVAVFLIFLLVPMPAALAKASIVLVGLLQGCAMPALIIMACEAFPTRTASASSLIVLGVSLAILIIPALMGYLMKGSGYLTPMLVIAGGPLVAALTILPVEKIGQKIERQKG